MGRKERRIFNSSSHQIYLAKHKKKHPKRNRIIGIILSIIGWMLVFNYLFGFGPSNETQENLGINIVYGLVTLGILIFACYYSPKVLLSRYFHKSHIKWNEIWLFKDRIEYSYPYTKKSEVVDLPQINTVVLEITNVKSANPAHPLYTINLALNGKNQDYIFEHVIEGGYYDDVLNRLRQISDFCDENYKSITLQVID